MQFYKYQGTGNDFIMVNDLDGKFPALDQSYIEGLCDRRFGIGADGLILLQKNQEGRFYMQYFNSDGRESSMCGNGGRCFAQFIFDLNLAKDSIEFWAIDGKHSASIVGSNIALQMIPVNEVNRLMPEQFELNTGSPHYVQFLDASLDNFPLVDQARKIRYNEVYQEKGINVNYLNLKGLKDIVLRTYERGVEDETLSCGTGATAAALATAIYNQLPEGSHQIKVKVMGGELAVKFHFHTKTNSFSDIWLIGPAQKVFSGNL